MRQQRRTICVTGMLLSLFYMGVPAMAAPSPKLAVALDKKAAAVPQGRKLHLRLKVGQILHEAEVLGGPDMMIRVSIEHDGNLPEPKPDKEIPAGALRTQLTTIAESVGYTWQADGDWVNLIPKSKVKDRNYVMNQVIPGKVILSRDPAVATPIREWLESHRISVSREYNGLRFTDKPKVYGPDPIELNNPTLREYANAHESLYGNDQWAVYIKEIADEKGLKPPRISLVTWGQQTRAPAPASQPSK